MKILWLLFVLHTVFAQPGFGKSYLRNSRLCHQWSCINNKLGLPDALPSIEEFKVTLRSLLPGPWQALVDRVAQTCYNDRPRRYTNTCPGQALLQCTVDQIVNNCPDASLKMDDACAPVNSLAGLDYMFSQSRYESLERNIAIERRPVWFLRNYFNSKCCDLPELFNSTVLTECGFHTMLVYFKHNPQFEIKPVIRSEGVETPVIFHYSGTEISDESDNTLHFASLKDVKPEFPIEESTPDPLSCCDMSEFIDPEWRRQCAFQLEWSPRRLSVKDENIPLTTPVPERTVTHRDLVVLPQTCEQETCVFDKLNITKSGSVDIEAFKKLLDSLTDSKPEWNRAKARVVTTCLSKPIKYVADCDINKVLACTFDVLSENCPINETAPKHDACKHSKDDRVCQISSSKSRPKHRRSVCDLPELVEKSILTECNVDSLSRVEQVVQTAPKPKYSFASWRHKCLDLTASTSCLLRKMGVLNKYGFMDYFQMKDKVRRFGENNEWSEFLDVYLNAFTNNPLYKEHCNSAKKFLNIIDSMLLTCPLSKRSNTPLCTELFHDITNTPAGTNTTKQHSDQVLNHFHHLFFPSPTTPKSMEHTTRIIRKPLYSYGVLTSAYVPKVEIIDVKPKDKGKTLVLLPVYMRRPTSLAFQPNTNVGVFRSSLGMNSPILQDYDYTTPVSSTPVTSTPVLSTPVTSKPVSSTPVSSTPDSSTPISSTLVSSTPIMIPDSTTPITNSTSISIPI